ncbi:hypothetical protein RRG08_053669 [Elysia crispata]|uniref:EGF-like domain-containing protein n=1 Tax=Elysia crispata TaxID=231223 RepID=A0AAE0ZPN0_9GAST|nr:hypothetical protein RRG08_053669 [Elysia crispata]
MRNQNLIHGVACMAWKSPGLALALAVLFCGSTIQPACSQQLVLNLPHKQFLISEGKFAYSIFAAACSSSGLEMGVIDTNSEYSHLQAAMLNLFQAQAYHFWLFVNFIGNDQSYPYNYWWTKEEVNATFWWPEEPNLMGHPDSISFEPNCVQKSLACRPIAMSTYGSDKPLLQDECCVYQFSGICMRDVNECLTPSSYNCTANSVCVNLPYSYTCQCLAGFEKINDECHDIDECKDPEIYPCPSNSECKNVAGSYLCLCNPGHAYDRLGHCQDINECKHQNTYPCPDNSFCENTVGNYHCPCDPGYVNNSLDLCQDIDECADSAMFNCPDHSFCKNTVGSYLCPCLRGYIVGDSGTCQDIDECTHQDTNPCPANSDCENTAGSYHCRCDPGYVNNRQRLCQDIDECADPVMFDCPDHSFCNNTVGSYLCPCLHGYIVADNGTCQDIDECLDSSPCPDNTVCTNTAGGFTCSTAQGTGLKLCTCQCPNFPENLSLPVEKSLQKIRKRLIVDTSNLSSKVRRLSSAEDRRASSVSMGTAAVALIVLALTVFTLPDVISSCLWLWRHRKNFLCK